MKKKIAEFNIKLQVIQTSGTFPKEMTENERKLLQNLINYGENEEFNSENKPSYRSKKKRGRKEQKNLRKKPNSLAKFSITPSKREEIKEYKPNFPEFKPQQFDYNITNSIEKTAFKALDNQKFLEIFEKVFDTKNLIISSSLPNELNISDFSQKISNNHDKNALNDEISAAKDVKNYGNTENFLWNTPNRRMIKESPIYTNEGSNFITNYDQFSSTIATKNTDKISEKREDFITENGKNCEKDIYSPNKYIASFESPSRFLSYFYSFF